MRLIVVKPGVVYSTPEPSLLTPLLPSRQPQPPFSPAFPPYFPRGISPLPRFLGKTLPPP
jgi:hypothetical protein